MKGRSRDGGQDGRRSGSALIVALWVLITLSLLVGAFAFDMTIEAGITSYYRKRLKSQYLAQAGVEYAKFVLAKSFTETAEGPEDGDEDDVYIRAMNLQRGMGVNGLSQEMGSGRFTLDILPEPGRRNVKTLDDTDWEEILDQANIPQETWDSLVDCYDDWVDPDDEHRLNGAESDDSFYEERGYECKNGPLDTVDELALIKGFSQAVVYGGPGENEDDEPLLGIAQWLTVWGDGKVNVNTASREVLLTVRGIEDYDVDGIIEGRKGFDKTEGTKDDGFESVDDMMAAIGLNDPALKEKFTTMDRRYVRVVSIGEVGEVRNGIWCVLQADATGIIPLFWKEEAMP